MGISISECCTSEGDDNQLAFPLFPSTPVAKPRTIHSILKKKPNKFSEGKKTVCWAPTPKEL